MKLYKISISKAKLDLMSENERIFFIQISHFENEINILRRLFLWSSLLNPCHAVEEKVRHSQALFVAKVFTGKLNEGWELIQNGFFKSGLSKTYESRLNNQAQKDLSNLKSYFSKSNIINKIRKKFSFHYSAEEIKACYKQLSPSIDFDIYRSKDPRNNFYQGFEVLVNNAIMEFIDPGKPEKAMDLLSKDINDVTEWFLSFNEAFMIEITKKYLGENLQDIGAVEFDIPEPPKFDEIRLPYFVIENDSN